MIRLCLLASWLLVGPYPGSSAAEKITQGVAEISAPGIPGNLIVFGEDAFPLVCGKVSGTLHAPVVAGAIFGKGRIVALGHPGYFSAQALAASDTGKLMRNALSWAGGEKSKTDPPCRVAVLEEGDLAAFLEGEKFSVKHLAGAAWSRDLARFDVLCLSSHALNEAEIEPVQAFVRGGGGLLVTGLGWGWLQLNPGKKLADHPGNRLLGAAGILWGEGYLERTSGSGYSLDKSFSRLTQASAAVEALAENARSGKLMAPGELPQAVWTASTAVRALPPQDALLRPQIQALAERHRDRALPKAEKPLQLKDGLARFLLAYDLAQAASLPVEQIRAHPAATFFPGDLPSKAARGERVLSFDGTVPGWQSTGLYAGPGEKIEISIPENAIAAGLFLRIGAHSDELWDLEEWKRVPSICRRFPLAAKESAAASEFGGLVYLEVPAGCRAGKFSVTIRHAAQAPRFVLGKTTLSDWKSKIRDLASPWAELETSKIVLTVPSSAIRALDDPEPLMRFWDRISDAQATLAGISLWRERPERFVADVQISAGYMHSGYPIMTHLDAAAFMTKFEDLRRGVNAWGLFHELGHNHQVGDWTFEGTGEVTNNVFVLYTLDTVCELAPGFRGHEAVDKPPSVRDHIAKGASFEKWKSDPFLALQMYLELQREFGWEPFQKVFAEYRTLADAERPKSEQDKRDQWMVRFGRACGKNLASFFLRWGIPVSAQAQKSNADLPSWLPKELKEKK